MEYLSLAVGIVRETTRSSALLCALCVCKYASMSVHYTYLALRIHVFAITHTHALIQSKLYTSFIHSYTHNSYAHNSCTHTLIHSYTHTLIHLHTYTHTLIHSYTHTLIHSYTLTHSYTHSPLRRDHHPLE